MTFRTVSDGAWRRALTAVVVAGGSLMWAGSTGCSESRSSETRVVVADQETHPHNDHPESDHPQSDHPQSEHPQSEHPQREHPQREHPQREGLEEVASEAYPPAHVWLPVGFRALEMHYHPENPEDHYNGWPRYIVSDRDDMMMAYVPTQTFTFGGGLEKDEIPSRVITVPHFYMDLHEVTNAQYVHHCRSTGRTPRLRYWVRGVNDAHPARAVTWDEADDYAAWAGKSIPTEAQWEAAARGSDRRIYPWGNEEQVENAPYLCNARTGLADFDGHEFTAPVLTYAAGVSPFGHFNLAGNVAEWCYDWYDLSRLAWPTEEDLPSERARGAKPFGQRNYPNAEYKTIRESFVGPVGGSQRVVKGGSFADPIEDCRVDTRMGVRPEARQHNIGFRCVLTLPPDEAAVAVND